MHGQRNIKKIFKKSVRLGTNDPPRRWVCREGGGGLFTALFIATNWEHVLVRFHPKMKYRRKQQNYNSKRYRALLGDLGASTWDNSSRQSFITDRHAERKIILKMYTFTAAVQFSAGGRLSSFSNPDRFWGPPSILYNGHSTSFLVRKPKATWS
jgi:hypothetical protein